MIYSCCGNFHFSHCQQLAFHQFLYLVVAKSNWHKLDGRPWRFAPVRHDFVQVRNLWEMRGHWGEVAQVCCALSCEFSDAVHVTLGKGGVG